MKLRTRLLASVLFTCTLVTNAFAEPIGRSDLRGLKYPNSPEEGIDPVESFAPAFTGPYTGFAEMIPFTLASPDQEDAGSCLYMSLTGIAEWWLAKLNPNADRKQDGPVDLSERYLMNLAGMSEQRNGVANWKTDSIKLFNNSSRALKNSAYRFSKGWHTYDSNGNVKESTENARGAEYSTSINWLNKSSTVQTGFVTLPKFSRDVIFADPESNQWNVAVMPNNIVETVKQKLLTKKAPINVIYNHFGYWHAVNIVGFDQDLDSEKCPFVTRFETYLHTTPITLREQANESVDEVSSDKLIKRAEKIESMATKFDKAYKAGGGCIGKGMFYVRDSIYPDQENPYDYDKSQTGTEGFYSKTIVGREFEWLRYMANHATQIYVQ